jgi:hypothetical protein
LENVLRSLGVQQVRAGRFLYSRHHGPAPGPEGELQTLAVPDRGAGNNGAGNRVRPSSLLNTADKGPHEGPKWAIGRKVGTCCIRLGIVVRISAAPATGLNFPLQTGRREHASGWPGASELGVCVMRFLLRSGLEKVLARADTFPDHAGGRRFLHGPNSGTARRRHHRRVSIRSTGHPRCIQASDCH